MIIAIGTDIIEIERIKKAVGKTTKFLERIFTNRELDNLKLKGFRSSSVAGSFSAKEAISKVLGTGIGKISWHEIEVLNDEHGTPFVVLSGNAHRIAGEKGIDDILVSITHDRNMAMAYAIGQQLD